MPDDRDGGQKRGARIEDVVPATEEGTLPVNNRPHELVVVPVS